MTDNQLEKNDRLLEARKALGMTQVEMADLLGMDRGNLSNIEKKKNGRNVPKDASYILREKGISFRWFETGEGPMFIKDIEKKTYPSEDSQQRHFGEAQFPGENINEIRSMKPDTPEGFEEPPQEKIFRMTPEQKLTFALERNQEVYNKAIAALEKNVQLLEEISKLKDLLLEKEREIFHIKSPEKNGANDPVRV